jgi:quercetin dioxygenase-like cupin family protein
MSSTNAIAYVLPAGETRQQISSLGGTMRVLLGQADSAGALSVVEQCMDEPGGPPMHLHDDVDEWMIVLEGGPLTIQIGNERQLLHTGDSAWFPRNTPHTFANFSGQSVRILAAITPGGLEDFLDRQAKYLNGLKPNEQPDPAVLKMIEGEHNVRLGPPLLPSA